jgi:O-antigen ligase
MMLHPPVARRLAFIAVWSWVIAGLISSGISLLQYFGAASDFHPWINATLYGEAFANLRQRNQFATLTNMALAALFWLALQPMPVGRLQNKPAIRLALLLMATCLIAVGNAISSSRTGLFELLLLCALLLLWGRWRQPVVRQLLVAGVSVYAVAVFAMPLLARLDMSQYGLAARLGHDEACGSRLLLWSNVLHLIAQKPWMGWGWGELDYAHFITLYNEPRFCDILDNAHNLPLQLAVELGVPFSLLVCGGFAWWVVRQKPWAELDATRQMAWSVIAVILLHSMLEYPLWYGPFQIAFAACLWLLWRQKRPEVAEKSSNSGSNRPVALISYAQAATFIIAMALLASVIYAAWDYRRVSQIYLQPEARDAQWRDNTLNKIRGSRLFADQVQFAELLITPLTPNNADWTFHTATALLHYSPEPRVVEKLIESAVMLGRDDDAVAYLARYRAAFPKEHALWAQATAIPGVPPKAKPD